MPLPMELIYVLLLFVVMLMLYRALVTECDSPLLTIISNYRAGPILSRRCLVRRSWRLSQ
jgi:hypothetical protein